MQLNQNTALEKLSLLGMDDMPVIEYTPKKCIIDKNWFNTYTTLRKEFLTTLTDSLEEIAFMNLSQDEFMNIIMGKALPTNTSIRFKIPLLWGGDLSINNMFMCYTFPQSHNLDKFIIDQSDARTIYLPYPNKKIYITTHMAGGGAGGNAASDRLSQTNFNSSRDF